MFLVFMLCWIKYHHFKLNRKQYNEKQLINWLNEGLLWIGFVSGLGIYIVANIQVFALTLSITSETPDVCNINGTLTFISSHNVRLSTIFKFMSNCFKTSYGYRT